MNKLLEWIKKDKEFIENEMKELGFNGRFEHGYLEPPIVITILQHMASKMSQDEKGSRMAII